MALQMKVVTAAAPADAALLANHLLARYIDRSQNGLAKDFKQAATTVAASMGWTLPLIKAFKIQPAFAALMTAFSASITDVDTKDAVDAIIAAIGSAQTTHQGANAGLYTSKTPFDVWAGNAAPSLNTDLDAGIAGATVAAAELALTLTAVTNADGAAINYINGF